MTVAQLGIYQRYRCSEKKVCLHLKVHNSNAHNSQTAEGDKMSFNRWMDKEEVVRKCMEYYSAIRKDEYLPFASTWMELEGIMLSEKVNQKKTIIIWFHSYVEYKKQYRGS